MEKKLNRASKTIVTVKEVEPITIICRRVQSRHRIMRILHHTADTQYTQETTANWPPFKFRFLISQSLCSYPNSCVCARVRVGRVTRSPIS